MDGKYLKINMGISNSYLIKGEEGYLLVDAGVEGKVDKLKSEMDEHDIEFGDIILIIITHVHYDHIGSLKEIKEKTEAPVLVHESEADLLKSGESYFPAGNNWIGKIISNFAQSNLNKPNTFEPIKPDIEMKEYYNLQGFGFEGEIIHTPGHSAGSITVIIENRHCFTGDTMFSLVPFTVNPPFADNPEELYKSWEKIAAYDCWFFYPGHGYMFSRNKFMGSLNRKRKEYKKK